MYHSPNQNATALNLPVPLGGRTAYLPSGYVMDGITVKMAVMNSTVVRSTICDHCIVLFTIIHGHGSQIPCN